MLIDVGFKPNGTTIPAPSRLACSRPVTSGDPAIASVQETLVRKHERFHGHLAHPAVELRPRPLRWEDAAQRPGDDVVLVGVVERDARGASRRLDRDLAEPALECG